MTERERDVRVRRPGVIGILLLALLTLAAVQAAHGRVRGGRAPPVVNSVVATPTDVSDDLRIFQFSGAYSVSGNSLAIPVAGTYTGGTPTSIECAAVDNTTHTTVISSPASMSAGGGTFSGTVTVPTRLGWNAWACWDDGNATVKTYTSNRWGVGLFMLFTGESNNFYMDNLSSSPPTPTNGTARFDHSAHAWGATTGNGEIRLANLLATNLNMNIAVSPYAITGATIAGWLQFNGYWNSLCLNGNFDAFNDPRNSDHAGGDFYLVHQNIGGNDAIAGTVKATYLADVATFSSELLTCPPGPRTGTSFGYGIASIGTTTVASDGSSGTSASWTDMRNADIEAAAANSSNGSFYLGATYDFGAVFFGYHFLAPDYEVIARRSARAILRYLGGSAFVACGGAGPVIATVTAPAGTTTQINFNVTHNGCGTTLLASGGGSAGTNLSTLPWRCFKNGTPVTLSSPSFSSSTQIRWVSGTSFDKGSDTVTCDYMATKGGTDMSAVVVPYDNAPPMGDTVYPGAPLEPSDGQLTVQ